MRRLTLVFMIDALGFDQAEKGFLPEATAPRHPVETVLGYSSACIPSIMTGRPPSEHGHLSMYRRARPGEGVFSGPPSWIGRIAEWTDRGHWRMRQWLARYLRTRGITGYFALYEVPLPLLSHFDLCQRNNVYRPGAFSDVGLTGLGDVLADRDVARVWDWNVPEEQAFAELEDELVRGSRRVLFLYTPELDSLMHIVGPEDPRSRERLGGYSARIARALRLAEDRYDQVELYVFGDHGMAPVRGVHDLWSPIRELPFRAPRDFLYFLDSTMARFWFQHAGAEAAVRDLLAGQEYGRILEDEELVALGAKFGRSEYGELIFLLDEGHILVPSFMGQEPVRGMHGYHPRARASFTTLVTNQTDLDYPRDLFELHTVLRRSIERAVR